MIRLHYSIEINNINGGFFGISALKKPAKGRQ
jgi:hypothetical protein